jgi:hypothetical protein
MNDDNREFNEPTFLTKDQEEMLRDYYFNPENETGGKTEQDFTDWKEDISWDRIYSICGRSSEDLEDDDSE